MSWKVLESLKTARSHPAVVAVDGFIYAIGGGGSDFKSLNSVERYGTKDNIWENVANMPTTRSGTAGVAHNGKIYVIGGGYKKPDGKFCFLRTVEVYDIKSDSWESGPDMIESHDYPAVTFIDDEIYIIAGHHPDATEGGPKTDPGSKFCERFKIGSSRWEAVAPVSVPRFGPTANVVNGEIWAMGGVALSDAGFNNYDIIEIYNREQNQWRREEGIKLSWPCAAQSSVLHNDSLYVIGGYCGWQIHDRISVSSPASTAEFTDLEPMPEARAAMGAVVCDNVIYCVAGWKNDGRTPVDTLFSFSL